MFMNIERPISRRRVARMLPILLDPGSAQRETPRLESSAAHAAMNIAAWQSYLPADCIGQMIKMGWDRTT